MSSLKNELLMQKVKQKLATIYHCKSDDFNKNQHVFVKKKAMNLATSNVGNYGQPISAKIVTFGNNVVVYGNKDFLSWCEDRFDGKKAQEILDFPMLYKIETMLDRMNMTIDSINNRYLKLADSQNYEIDESFSLKWFEKGSFDQFYEDKRIRHAFSPKTGKDVLAVAAYKNEELAAIAACDSVWGYMWQIGLDTMPEYRGNGLGTYLATILSDEIENRGFIPFYSTWPANLLSAKVALASGFRPSWTEIHIADIK